MLRNEAPEEDTGGARCSGPSTWLGCEHKERVTFNLAHTQGELRNPREKQSTTTPSQSIDRGANITIQDKKGAYFGISRYHTKYVFCITLKQLIDFDRIAHYEICYTRNTVHHDISYNNIMLFKDEDSTTKLRRGLLIDFDYAAKIKDKGKVSPGHRTVCTSIYCPHHYSQLQLLLRELLLSWHWTS